MRKIQFLLLMLLPIVASAHDFEVDGIYYNRSGNRAIVTFKGSKYYTYSDEYTGDIVIPETVTYNDVTYTVSYIGERAFSECRGMTSIVIPSTILSIGERAFQDCWGLKGSIVIPNSVTIIRKSTFDGCRVLSNVIIPNSVTSIGDHAFSACQSLTSIDIPNSVTSIGKNAFEYCSSLTYIEIPNSVTSISMGLFWWCTSLTNVIIPNSVTAIDSYAFSECKSLVSIKIPNSVTSLGNYVFEECDSLESIEIPNSVTSIGNCIFKFCPCLNIIKVASDNPFFDSRENCNAIIETANNSLILGCQSSFIPNSVTSIGDFAFYCCDGLESIEIPNSVTSIGQRAFELCLDLTRVIIPNSVDSVGLSVFDLCDKLSTIIITGEGEWPGEALNCSIKSLHIDSRITSIKGLKINPTYGVFAYATTPPECDENTFTSYSGTLHVPAASLAVYFTSDYWSNFHNIVADAVELESVSINQESIEINLGDQFYLAATVTPSNASSNYVTWSSTDTNIARFLYIGSSNKVLVSAVGVGECDIIAECLNKRAVCHVVVNDTTVTITLDHQEAMLLPNHMLTLTPIPNPIVPDLLVTSSDPSVAAARVVNNKVQVVGITEGTTTITVGSVDGTAIPATCLVTVYTEPGDLNCDGFVNISDVTSLINYLLSGDDSQISTKNADVNGNESINISDVTALINRLLSGN